MKQLHASRIARVVLAIILSLWLGVVCLMLASCSTAGHSRGYYAKRGLHAPNRKLYKHITYRQWVKSQACPKLNRKRR